MRGVVAALVLLGCGSMVSVPDAPIDSDAGTTSYVELAVDRRLVSLARGETWSVDVQVYSSDSAPMVLTFGALPNGVAGSSIEWHGEASATLTLTTSLDAPDAEMDVKVRAMRGNEQVTDAPFHVVVTNVVGSPDPSFGREGLVVMSSYPHLVGIAREGAGWVVAGDDGSNALVARLDGSGQIGSLTTTPIPETKSSTFRANAMSLDEGGRVAVSGYTPDGWIAVVDATGALQSAIPTTTAGGAHAIQWTGNTLIAADGTNLYAIAADQSFTTLDSLGTPTAMRATDANTVYVAAGPLPLVQRYDSLSLDPTFSTSLPLGPMDVTGVDVDAKGRVLLAVHTDTTGEIVRMLPDGSLDASFGTNGVVMLDFVANVLAVPSGGALVLAYDALVPLPSVVGNGYWDLVRLTDTGALDTAFGANGRTPIESEPSDAAVDATGTRACVCGTGFVECYGL